MRVGAVSGAEERREEQRRRVLGFLRCGADVGISFGVGIVILGRVDGEDGREVGGAGGVFGVGAGCEEGEGGEKGAGAGAGEEKGGEKGGEGGEWWECGGDERVRMGMGMGGFALPSCLGWGFGVLFTWEEEGVGAEGAVALNFEIVTLVRAWGEKKAGVFVSEGWEDLRLCHAGSIRPKRRRRGRTKRPPDTIVTMSGERPTQPKPVRVPIFSGECKSHSNRSSRFSSSGFDDMCRRFTSPDASFTHAHPSRDISLSDNADR